MTSLTIRGIDDELQARLSSRAAARGHSVAEEAREILRDEFPKPKKQRNLYAAIRAKIEPLGGVELELPSRDE